MKKCFKTIVLGLSSLLLTAAPFTASASEETNDKVIKIGVSAQGDEMVQGAVDALKEIGYTLEPVLIEDVLQSNEAIMDDSIQLNFSQHEAYMQQFNEGRNGELTKVGDYLYDQIVGLFSKSVKSIEEIEDGATIAIQDDPSNQARSLRLLADAGLITLADDLPEGEQPSLIDIVENPKNLKFTEVAGHNLAKALDDPEIAAGVLRGRAIPAAGLTADDALYVSDRDERESAAIVLVTKKGNEETDWALAAYEGLKSKKSRDAIKEITGGTWVPLFDFDDEANEDTSK